MPTRNPDKTGELSKFYWQVRNTDLNLQTDAQLLADLDLKPFCIKNLSTSSSRDMREIMDRCNPGLKTYSPGRADKGLSFELNQFRWNLDDLRLFHDTVENAGIFTVMALNDERDQTEVWGIVGNFHIEENSTEEPEDGLNTESYTLKPAARSLSNPAVRYIYGSGIPATSTAFA